MSKFQEKKLKGQQSWEYDLFIVNIIYLFISLLEASFNAGKTAMWARPKRIY